MFTVIKEEFQAPYRALLTHPLIHHTFMFMES